MTEDMLRALRSLDEQQIRSYAKAKGVWLPPTERTFWGGVHRARLSLPEITEPEKEVSRAWLIANGFAPRGL